MSDLLDGGHVLAARFVAPSVRSPARRPHAHPELFEPPPPKLVIAKERDSMHRRTATAVAAQRDREPSPPHLCLRVGTGLISGEVNVLRSADDPASGHGRDRNAIR